MNELQIFNSEEFGDIRTVTINNEPYLHVIRKTDNAVIIIDKNEREITRQ